MIPTTSAPPHPSASAVQGILRSLLQVVFWSSLAIGTLDFLLPLYARAIGGSATFIGLLYGLGRGMNLLVRPVAGWQADRGHSLRVMGSGVGLVALGLSLMALAASVGALALGRVALAAGTACVGLAAQVLVAGHSRDQRGAAFGRLTATELIGFVAGGIVAVAIIGLFDAETQTQVRELLPANWHWPAPVARVTALHLVYGCYALLTLVALLPLLRLRQRVVAPERAPVRITIWREWRDIVQASDVRRLLLVGGLISIAYSLSIPLVLPLLQDQFEAGLSGVAIAYVIPAILYAAAPAPLGRRADRWGYRRSAVVALMISGGVYGLLPLVPGLTWVALLWSCEALSFSLATPALLALLTNATPITERGTAFSLYSVVGDVCGVLAAPLGGLLYEHSWIGAPFIASAVAFGGASVLLWRQRSVLHPHIVDIGASH